MRKFLVLLVALVLVCGQCFAAPTYTVTSRDRYTDDAGNNVVRTRGYITMDSSYPCDTSTTYACGYPFKPSNIGMTSISQMNISPQYSTNVGGVMLWKYHSSSLAGGNITQGSLRAYYMKIASAANTTQGGFASMPSYSLSDLTAVPFEAIGA